MKYPEGKMSLEASMPISVQSWFGHELEIRGIDAVVYTRYIISLLKQDQVELDPGEVDADHLWGKKCDLRKIRGKKSDRKKCLGVTQEEKKKNAAVECLLSISDEATDIEELIEELFTRLKEINAQKENQEPHIDPSNQGSGLEGSVTTSNSEDPAERYYAAFPALQGQGGMTQVSPSSQCDTSIWNKNPITNQPPEPSQDAPDDASDNCGQGGSDEVKSQLRTSQNALANRGVNTLKKSPMNRKSNNLKASKQGYWRQGKSKKDRGLNRAARLLSWPPDVQRTAENQRIDITISHANQTKARSVSPAKLEKRKNGRFSPCLASGSIQPRGPNRCWGPQSRRLCGFLSPVSPEFKEQECWYTQPMDCILSSTPDTKGRLFNRHSLSLSDRFSTGVPSSVESSPPESPNAFKETSVDDIWQAFEDSPQFSAGYSEMNLPAFFMDVGDSDQIMPPMQFSCLEQEPWSFPFPEALPDKAEPSDIQPHSDIIVGETRLQTRTSTTSDSCSVLDPNPVRDVDLCDSGKTDITAEIQINPVAFFDPVEEKPCSQSSPSQYKAWGSLPLEKEEFAANVTASFVPSPCESWSAQIDVKVSCSGDASPDVSPPPDPAGDSYTHFFSLSEISSPEPEKPLAEDAVLYIGDDHEFTCFLSDSSINLFGDLLNPKPQQVAQAPTLFENSDFLSFPAPKKQGVFSAALFSDLASPLFTDDIFMFASPWYEGYSLNDTILQKVWDTQHHLACKTSPLGPATTWFGVKTMESSDDGRVDDTCLHKICNSDESNYVTSPLMTSWLGTTPQDLTQPYIPFFSLWLQDDTEGVSISMEDQCSPQDSDQTTSQLKFEPVPCNGLWKPSRSVSLENLTKTLWETGNMENTSHLSKSFELVPSEHSAFEDVVPKKLSHVLSEPIIKYSQTSPDLLRSTWEDQSEHEGGAGADSQEHLFFSPKTHFRPIQTPEDQNHQVSSCEPPELHLKDLFGGHMSTSKTPYQSYMGMDQLEASFIPRFRVKKTGTKYVQTGCTVECAEICEKDEEEQMQEIFDDELDIVFEVLGDLAEISDSGGVIGREWRDPSDSSDTAPPPYAEDVLEEWNLRSLWSDSSELEPAKKESTSQPITPNKAYCGSIWSTGKDAEIPPLPELGSYEADQSLYWTSTETPSDYETSVTEPEQVLGGTGGAGAITGTVTDSPGVKLATQHSDQPEDVFKLEPDILNWTELAPLPHQAVYSSELEQKWLNSDDNSSDLSISDVKAKKRRSWKPCSFYLEGHCRRSDCKFAHDMSTITCRFWEDGDCFKGSTCPFLHGYPSYSDDTDSEPSTSRKLSAELKKEDLPNVSEPELSAEKMVKKAGASKSVKKASFVKKAWSTYWNNRGASKQREKEEKESIPRKN